jgi:hypothetical protein
LIVNNQSFFYKGAQRKIVMNTKTTVIAIAALVAVLGLLVAPLSLSVASAKLTPTPTCDGVPDPDGCPGASGTKGKGHEELICSEGTCPRGQNK